MAHTPPVPAANQSPYPLAEPPHADPAPAETGGGALDETLTSARETVAPLAEKAKAFAKARPWATAALAATVGVAILNTLRGRGR